MTRDDEGVWRPDGHDGEVRQPRDRQRKATPEERSEQNRRNVEVRWARHRAARLAAGLPATRREELGRRPTVLDDPEVRRYWRERVRELGIDRVEAQSRGVEEITTRQLDRLAVALSESETVRLAETPPQRVREESGDDERTLVAFHGAQAASWRRRAEQERALAREHDRRADEHERALVDLLMRGPE